ncbi:MAG: hypothetical protein AAGA70_16855 [Pseudomonadota bacterium]
MTALQPWSRHSSDPLPQLLADHGSFGGSGNLVVPSQVEALAHWPEIEGFQGEVAIVLRRQGQEDTGEWRDVLAIFRRLVSQSERPIRLLALTQAAADSLAAELALSVTPAEPLPRGYRGTTARVALSRSNGPLQLRKGPLGPFPARRYNLARLRRRAIIEADPNDADLSDIATFANGEKAAQPATQNPQPVIVIVVPNGTGLGHVTRMLAVAGKLRQSHAARVVFWSFSHAAGIIHRAGFETVLRQTAKHLGADLDDWLLWETEEFASALGHLRPDLVVQDASNLQHFIIDALARPQRGAARLALIRRGMWQKHVLGTEALAAEQLADLVVEPGDLAAPADRGVTRGRFERTDSFADMAVSAPVTLTRKDQLLPARQARRALGLGWGRHCLVSLGGDELWDWSPVLRDIVEAAQKQRIGLVWARSPLSLRDPGFAGSRTVLGQSRYPLAPYLAAFDGVISAVGYNSFHELMQLYDKPVLLVPRQHSRLDDQMARAQFAAAQGWATHLPEGEPAQATISSFMADIRQGKVISSRPAWRDGAAEIADALGRLLESGA